MKKIMIIFFRSVSVLILTFIINIDIMASKVDTVEIYSVSMNKKVPAVVITPNSYKNKVGLPVIYLLHGYSDNYSKWVKTVPSIKDLADKYQVIVVCPDGGFGSWYLNSPFVKEHKYETFISTELIQWIDKNYKTNPSKFGRAITGLSMGGHGAMLNAVNHPEKYSCVGSLSGALNLLFEHDSQNDLKDLKADIGRKLGDINEQKDIWKANSVVYMIDKIKASNLFISIDCGVNDFLIEDNRDLHKKLLDAKVQHDYTERPGGHEWSYWANVIEYQFLAFSRILQSSK